MIYLDYQATTPLAPEARAAMLPWLEDRYGNPHSPHRMGRAAAAAVEVARGQVLAALLADAGAGDRLASAGSAGGTGLSVEDGASVRRGPSARDDASTGDGFVAVVDQALSNAGIRPAPSPAAPAPAGRLFFTSGATEALNWAIKGTWARRPAGRNRVVTVATEHAAVLDTIGMLGAEVVVLPVDRDGRFDPAEARAAIDGRTALVAAMLVNNEIGTIGDVAGIGALAKAAGAAMICDAVQGFGRVPVPMAACDMIAISAHKIHGPKGIGALWVREGCEPAPLLHGGGQEGGIRSGTLSPMLCAGFGAAAVLAQARMAEDIGRISGLYDRLRGGLGEGWHVNGARTGRWPGNLNIRHDGVDAARLISELRGIAFSAGSACASGSGRPSHVLKAIGLTDGQARGSIRLGFGRYTTEEEIDMAARQINEAADRQRAFA